MTFERVPSGKAGPALGSWFGGVLVAGGVLATLWFRLGLPIPICLFREWTGIPCPTCGATRMVAALLAGDPLGAAAQNPLLFLALCGIALWSLASTARLAFDLPVWRIALSPRERLGLRLTACAVLAVSWAYLIWR
jgi:hypothetical protein